MFAIRNVMIGCVAIGCLAAPASAHPAGGNRVGIHRVEAFTTDVFTVKFHGDEDGAVAISGDGDTDLDLYVYDDNGNLIGADTDGSDDCVVRFHPRWTGTFRIEVRNLGGVWNRYKIGCF